MLLGTLDLPGDTLTPEQVLIRAEALVAAAICPALPTLEVRTWTLEYRARNDLRGLGVPLYGRRHLGPTILRYWPVTALVSVTENGVDVTAECVTDTFSVRRDALSREFDPLGLLRVVFQTGWSSQDVPPAILEAVLLTARHVQDTRGNVQLERLGDAETRYFTPVPQGVPPEALALLRAWRYVGV